MSWIFTLLLGCADPLADAQKANTVEAYEAYLATEPDGSNKMIAESSLCNLLIKTATDSKQVAAYDAAIKRCPKHVGAKKIREDRVKAAFAEAERVNTAEAWKKFLDENDSAEAKMKSQARDRVAVAEYGDKLQAGPVIVKKINLANDPKGPLNGWGFTSNVTNAGTNRISYLSMELRFLNGEGQVIGTKRYPLVAESAPGGLPINEGYEKPLGPGQSRVWDYSTDEVPDGWVDKAELVAVKVRFEGTPKTQGPAED